MHLAAAIRIAEHAFQEFHVEVARERQAIAAERTRNLASPTRHYSFTSIVATVVAILGTAGSLPSAR